MSITNLDEFRDSKMLKDDLAAGAPLNSTTGGDGPTYGKMNERLTALETHFGYVRKDLDALAAGQSEIHKALGEVSSSLNGVGYRLDIQSAESKTQAAELRSEFTKLPTKNDLWAWKIQYAALGLAMVAIIIGGIIGGLAWIAPSGASGM